MMRIPNNFRPSMVYMMTNGPVTNEVVAFYRNSNGMLTFVGSYPTGGKGTGAKEVSTATPNEGVDPLASKGALALSLDGCFLFAVNAGSNTISSFVITASGQLVLADVKPSGGAQPNGLDMSGDLLYVSNVGNAANNFTSNINGFRINGDGRLLQIPGSTHALSTNNAQPAGVSFTPDGSKIVVSEYTTNHLSVFKVSVNGTVTGPVINHSYGKGPFGSYFLSSGILLVTEVDSNSLSSYSISDTGILKVISGAVPTGQKATCWVIATRDERFAYTTNTLNGTITIYRIHNRGVLTVIGTTSSTPAGSAMGLPIDVGISRDGCNFYTLNGNQGTISVFYINTDGSLVRVQIAASAQTPYLGAQGLVVL